MPARPRELRPDRSARDLFGYTLRFYRTRAGLSLTALAEELRYSKTHLGNIETAERTIPPGLPQVLDEYFKTDGEFARIYRLARHEVHPTRYRRYMELEAEAEFIGHYAPSLVPGLLQTEDYARAALSHWAPDGRLEELVSARMARQERLFSSNPPTLHAVLDEAVLMRSVGGSEAMRAQLAHLLGLAEILHITIQVVCFEVGAHPGMSGAFTVLNLPDGNSAAYAEGSDVGRVFLEPDEVKRRIDAYDQLRTVALPPTMSVDLIRCVMEDL